MSDILTGSTVLAAAECLKKNNGAKHVEVRLLPGTGIREIMSDDNDYRDGFLGRGIIALRQNKTN